VAASRRATRGRGAGCAAGLDAEPLEIAPAADYGLADAAVHGGDLLPDRLVPELRHQGRQVMQLLNRGKDARQ